jgi:8-oxo-dGTP pyrophosphatase MutT (NUDIX family)
MKQTDQEELVRLLEEYKPYLIDAEEKELFRTFHEFAAGAEEPYRRESLRHATASAIVLNPARDKVLLIFAKKYDRWLQPGGHVEPGEHPYMAAKREMEEETGVVALDCFPNVFDIDIHEAVHVTDPKEVTHLDLRFLCIADDTLALPRETEEANKIAWVPLENIGDGTLGNSRLRLAKKISALSSVLGEYFRA